MKKLVIGLIFILLLLLVSGVASAIPPFVSGSESFTTGLVVEAPIKEYALQGSNLSLEFHLYNISNGLEINGNLASCHAHFFDFNGSELFSQDALPHENHFDLFMAGGNITTLGTYEFTIHCNTTAIGDNTGKGGFFGGAFEVTKTGEGQNLNSNHSFYILTIIFLFFTLITIGGIIYSKSMHIKVILTILLTILITTLTRFAGWFVEITNPYQVNLISTLQKFYAFSIWGMRISILFAIFYLIYIIFTDVLAWKQKKKEGDWEL